MNVGNVNSIRYRGYYWDSEFSLYYLQSRYYDPALGRFISPDSISYLNPESIVGFNLYAYCGDNPIINVDPKGTWSWGKFWDIFTTVGSVVAGVTVGIAVGVATKNVVLGLVAGVATFGIINNAVNAIYYACSDGQSTLDGSSYNNGYVTRWDRLDYAKQQTGEKSYFSRAWRYYGEYSFHMYGWFALRGFYEEGNNTGLSGLANRFRIADVEKDEWDSRWYVNVATVIFGILGI